MGGWRSILERWQQREDDELVYETESLAPVTAWQVVEDAARQAMARHLAQQEGACGQRG